MYSKKIAILGGSGQIAQGLFELFKHNNDVILFGRNNPHYSLDTISKTNFNFDLIINAAGPGDPATHRELGNKIYKITEEIDQHVLRYLESNNETKYVYLSTGAIYQFYNRFAGEKNGIFEIPYNAINNNINHYALSKLYSEMKHRSLSKYKIWDIRIFGYISTHISINSKFFVAQVINSLLKKELFKTNTDDFIRDFINAKILADFISILVEKDPPNSAWDIFSEKPVGKFELLESLKNYFGLDFIIEGEPKIIELLPKTISLDESYKKLGFSHGFSSLDIIKSEIKNIL